jgi:hypothetical protein
METAVEETFLGSEPPGAGSQRLAFLRAELADRRLALASARAAYLYAQQLAARRPRLRVDWPMLLGFVLALPLGALVALVVSR